MTPKPRSHNANLRGAGLGIPGEGDGEPVGGVTRAGGATGRRGQPANLTVAAALPPTASQPEFPG